MEVFPILLVYFGKELTDVFRHGRIVCDALKVDALVRTALLPLEPTPIFLRFAGGLTTLILRIVHCFYRITDALQEIVTKDRTYPRREFFRNHSNIGIVGHINNGLPKLPCLRLHFCRL